ncbi:MAG: 23S rRNA (pseudouridine(1915)-N(3))-methyltransferase RlmH [Proteobacteria bacterium]|nr:23S rRNA (pseudouridine(1915)-N(3))-methyltransferase RlmH [Pseudomonadota bacterium]NOG60540.1 23S rRNA (pseudouridine(1915)-N(3))-methyltransferase RlmH [Pseudomonadota bacterium]
MQIDLIAVGKRMPTWIESGFKEYAKRLPKSINFKLIEINPAIRSKNNSADNYKQKEEENIKATLSPDSLIIALDEHGKSVNSQSLANQLQIWNDENRHISLIIGGADGLSETIKNKANQLWSLSEMTLPHGLARVMIVEQIYRAWTITQNHPYHRE